MEADVRDLFDEDALFDPFDDGPDGDFDPEAAAQVTVGAPLTAEEAAPKAAAAPAVDTRTAQERFRDLLKETPGQRCVMLTLVDYAREPKTGAEMDVRTEELLRYGFSIYSPVVFRELLEEAGALRYMLLDDEGNEIAVDEAAGGVAGEADAQSGMDDAAAETVVAGSDVAVGAVSGAASSSARAAVGVAAGVVGAAVAGAADVATGAADAEPVLRSEQYFDGEETVELEFLEVADERPGLWVATPEGLEVVDEQDDTGEIRKLLAAEPQYLDIYHQILDFCCEEGGRSAKEIDRLVNDSPLLEEPRRYSGYFVGRLERKGALEWRGGWCTTQVGRDMIEEALAAAAQ